MAGKQMGGGGFEAELQRIRALDDALIPRMSAVINAFTSLERALSAVRLSEHWTGSSAESATKDIDEIRANVSGILETVRAVDSAIVDGNSARREIAAAELPSASVDPFWANAAKGASFVIHPVLGPLAADTALDAIGDFLGNQREDRARQIVNDVESSLVEPTSKLTAATNRLNEYDYVASDPSKRAQDPFSHTPVERPDFAETSGIGGGPSGYPGGGAYQPPSGGVGEYQPPISTNPNPPTYPMPDPTYPTYPTPDPTYPTYPEDPGDGPYDPDGPGGPGNDDPTVDFPGGGVLPGGPGGTGGGYPTGPGGSLPGGSFPGGTLPGGGIGGGIGGVVGGGAGAAAIAAGSKIAGIGSMGALGGTGAGGASGAGLKAGGGLLGKTAVGSGAGGAGGAGGAAGAGRTGAVGGVGGVGGAGGAGGSAGSSGAAGSGMRPGMGMMGGAGGADEEEKGKRSGLGGPVAPKLEDEEERGPRAKSAQAGSRDDHAQ